jgi:hypothetical protein
MNSLLGKQGSTLTEMGNFVGQILYFGKAYLQISHPNFQLNLIVMYFTSITAVHGHIEPLLCGP